MTWASWVLGRATAAEPPRCDVRPGPGLTGDALDARLAPAATAGHPPVGDLLLLAVAMVCASSAAPLISSDGRAGARDRPMEDRPQRDGHDPRRPRAGTAGAALGSVRSAGGAGLAGVFPAGHFAAFVPSQDFTSVASAVDFTLSERALRG